MICFVMLFVDDCFVYYDSFFDYYDDIVDKIEFCFDFENVCFVCVFGGVMFGGGFYDFFDGVVFDFDGVMKEIIVFCNGYFDKVEVQVFKEQTDKVFKDVVFEVKEKKFFEQKEVFIEVC